MSKVNRNDPKRSTASESRYTLFEFERDFPDDAACLDYLVGELYPRGINCPTGGASRSTTGRRRDRRTRASSAGTARTHGRHHLRELGHVAPAVTTHLPMTAAVSHSRGSRSSRTGQVSSYKP